MPKKVEALSMGYHDGKRRRAGEVFVIGDKEKPGKWMMVLKDVPPEVVKEVAKPTRTKADRVVS